MGLLLLSKTNAGRLAFGMLLAGRDHLAVACAIKICGTKAIVHSACAAKAVKERPLLTMEHKAKPASIGPSVSKSGERKTWCVSTVTMNVDVRK
jgi:hypothetical protein